MRWQTEVFAVRNWTFLCLIYQKRKGKRFDFVLASVVGTIGSTVAMLVLNYIYAVPLYAQFANFDISAILGLGNYLFAMVVPFNLIEGVIFSISFFILWTCLKPILTK